MAKDRNVVLIVVILTVVTLQWVTSVKVVETRRSLNLTTYDDNELIHTNEVTDWNETKNDENLKKNYQNDLDEFPGKPTKFDLDITQLTHTDDKNLHRLESVRLSNTSMPMKTMNRRKKSVTCDSYFNVTCLQEKFEDFIDTISNAKEYNVTDMVQIVKSENSTNDQQNGLSLIEKVQLFAKNHVLKIHIPSDLISARKSRTFFGCKYYQRKVCLHAFHYQRCFSVSITSSLLWNNFLSNGIVCKLCFGNTSMSFLEMFGNNPCLLIN